LGARTNPLIAIEQGEFFKAFISPNKCRVQKWDTPVSLRQMKILGKKQTTLTEGKGQYQRDKAQF
jgi:hypothetical protein